MTAMTLHLIFALGGGIGAVARFLLTTSLTHRYPLSTLLVNIIGCFVLGLGMVWLWEVPGLLGEQERHWLAGFCGGFTTFSSFAYQSLDLHRRHSLVHAAVNIGMNVVLCVAAFLAGRWAGGGMG